MQPRLSIRPAELNDVPALLDLLSHLDPQDARCPADEAIAIFHRFHLSAGCAILVGALGETIVASCTLAVIPNLSRGGKPYALIENVVTHADHRRRGFGKALLRAATERAWNEGCYKVMLMTGSTKPATMAFYTAAGFEQSKTGFQIRRHPARIE
jgi:GNAT superfamily N-acetyltransferase